MDHGFGDINGVFVVAYEPPPARHPSKADGLDLLANFG